MWWQKHHYSCIILSVEPKTIARIVLSFSRPEWSLWVSFPLFLPKQNHTHARFSKNNHSGSATNGSYEGETTQMWEHRIAPPLAISSSHTEIFPQFRLASSLPRELGYQGSHLHWNILYYHPRLDHSIVQLVPQHPHVLKTCFEAQSQFLEKGDPLRIHFSIWLKQDISHTNSYNSLQINAETFRRYNVEHPWQRKNVKTEAHEHIKCRTSL